MEKKIRILLVDDHQLFREGVKRILEMEESMTVIGESANGYDAIRLARELSPDIILMDINMPKMNGVEATARLKKAGVDARVIILSIHDDENYVRETLRNGADGYLLKEMDTDALIEAVQTVSNGQCYIHPKVTGKVIDEFRRLAQEACEPDEGECVFDSHYEALTRRELEVLQLMAEGKSNRTIGQELFISEKTVKNHVSSILQKLNVQDRTQAVVLAIKNRWVKIS